MDTLLVLERPMKKLKQMELEFGRILQMVKMIEWGRQDWM